MTIKTKFDIGQIVWIIFNNQPETWRVVEIQIGNVNTSNIIPKYKLIHHGNSHLGNIHETILWEYQIGTTKRELLKSFITDEDYKDEELCQQHN